jgi:hypothetical protein
MNHKKKLVMLDDPNAYYWEKQKVDWAIQDKKGVWWIIPGSEFSEQKISNEDKVRVNKKRMKQRSHVFSVYFYLWIFISSILGISLAVNLLYFLGVL